MEKLQAKCKANRIIVAWGLCVYDWESVGRECRTTAIYKPKYTLVYTEIEYF